MKRREIKEVIAKFAHEIRNPLQKILLNVHMLEKDLRVTGKAESRLEIIADIVNEVNRLVEELLRSSKTSKLELEALDLSHLIENVLKDLQHEIRRAKVQIIKDYAINLPRIRADRLKINQVFINLIMTAVQAMPRGGTLSITNEIITGRELQEILGLQKRDISTDMASKNFIKIIFSYTGVGIVREALPNIFTPFDTTKESGIGLGLPIVKDIVETHGGFIHVESQENLGSRFFILLPIIDLTKS